jgi:hypothetical protein
MRNFILSNWPTILLCIAVFFYVFYLAWNKRWDKIRKLALKAILKAEKGITGSKAGQQRFNVVLNQVYTLIPGWIRFFVSEESFREKLQQWFDEIKDYLDDLKINGSIKR